MRLEFTVLGRPEPQGSARAFIPKGWTRAVITSDNASLKPWRQDVALQAMAARVKAQHEVTREAVAVQLRFYFLKPKSTPKYTVHKTTKPDVDKCARAILDSLTSTVFFDDSQVVALSIEKAFGIPERVDIEITTVGEI